MPANASRAHRASSPAYVYFGISRLTFTLEQVWLSRTGLLTGLHNGTPVSRLIPPGSSAKDELEHIFDLTDVVQIIPTPDLWACIEVKALEEKAAALRLAKSSDTGSK